MTEVVLASVAGFVTAIVVLSAVRAAFPSVAPDVGRFVREGGEYLKDDYRMVAAWAVMLVGFASACTFFAAGWTKRSSKRSSITPTSRWWEMFCEEAGPDERVWVTCTLEDGTYLAGPLGPFSANTDETGDRELVLVGPVDYRGPDDGELTSLDVSAIISAKRILYLGVAYLPAPAVHEETRPGRQASRAGWRAWGQTWIRRARGDRQGDRAPARSNEVELEQIDADCKRGR